MPMSPEFQTLKASYPDMGDGQFAVALHRKFYPDMPMADFLGKVGLDRGEVLFELRAPGNPLGDYVRQALATPGTGETGKQAAVRQGGQIPERRADTPEGMARAALQGLTFGFGDELVAGGAAVLDPLVNGNPTDADLAERFNTYLSREQGLVENFREDSPVAAYGTEIGGAVLSPVNRIFGPLAAMGAAGGTFGKLAASAGTSALEGALYGFGSTNGDMAQRGQGAVTGGVLGGVGGTVLPLAARGVQAAYRGGKQAVQGLAHSGAVNRAVQAAPSAGAIKATSQASYDAAKATGAEIAQRSTQALRSRTRALLQDEGLILPNGTMAGGYPKLKNAVESIWQYTRGPVNITEAQRIAKMLRRAAESADGDEARLGVKLLDEFESYMDALPMSAFSRGNGQEAVRQWTKARNEWARFKRTQALETAIEKAAVHSGGFARGIRSQFAQILRNPKRKRGFSSAELDAMRKVAEGGSLEEFLRFLQRGGVLPAYLMGHVGGGPLMGSAMAAGKMAGNAGIRALSNRQARKVADQIRAQVATPGGLPLPRPLPPPAPVPDAFRRFGARSPSIGLSGG